MPAHSVGGSSAWALTTNTDQQVSGKKTFLEQTRLDGEVIFNGPASIAPINLFKTQYEPAGTNHVTNPSFEVDIAGWTAQNAGTTLSRATNVFVFGGASLAAAITEATTYGGAVGNAVPVTLGEVVTISAWFRLPVSLEIRCQTVSFNSAGADMGIGNFTDVTIPANSWTRVTNTATITAGVATIKPYFMLKAAAPVGGTTLNLDGVQVEKNSVVTSYIDGAQGTGFAWTGTAHASTSTRAANTVLRVGRDIATTNMIVNPSFGESTNGWGVSGGTIIRTDIDAKVGTHCGLVVFDYTAAATYKNVQAPSPTGAASTAYSASFWIKGVGGSIGRTLRVALTNRDANDAYLTSIALKTVHITGEWQRFSISGTSATNAARIGIGIDNSGHNQIDAYTFLLDGFQIEQQANATSYTDGSLGTGYAWTGTPHASTSTRAANTIIPAEVKIAPPYATVADPAAINLIQNPRFEIDNFGWRSHGAGEVVRDTSSSTTGASCGRVDIPAGANYIGFDSVKSYVPVRPGEEFVVSLDFKTSVAPKNILPILRFRNAAGADVGDQNHGVVGSSLAWRRISWRAIAPASATVATVLLVNNGTDQGAYSLYMTRVQVERGRTATSYIDGSLGPGYSWEGTPHASPSRRTGGMKAVGRLSSPGISTCRAYQTATQSIANVTTVTVQLNAIFAGEGYSNWLDDATDTIIAPYDGWYFVNAKVAWDANGTGSRQTRLMVDSEVHVWTIHQAMPQHNSGLQPTALLYAKAGTRFRIDVYQDAGAAVNLSFAEYRRTFLEVTYLGAR